MLEKDTLHMSVDLFRRKLADLVEGHVCLGDALNGTGKYNEAIEDYQKAYEIGGDPPIGAMSRGGRKLLMMIDRDEKRSVS